MEASAEACLALILQTPAIATEPLSDEQVHTSPIGIHILGQDAHLLLSLWALKSFYHFAHVHYPLTVHLQGKNTQQMVSIVSHHFPQARLISQEAADAFVEPWLQAQDFKRLLATRSRYFPVMKLIDLRLLARTPLVLYFDTDVLFFQHPHELLSLPADISAAPHLFMRDDYPSYCITPSQARIDFGIDLIAFANSGVMRLVTDAIDLAACERFMLHPVLAQEHWHLEQTLHALNASAQGRLQLLPATYAMGYVPPIKPTLTARHFTSPIRALFVEEGIAHFLETGFMKALTDAKTLS